MTTLVRTPRSPSRWALSESPFDTIDRIFEDLGSGTLFNRGDAVTYPMDLYETDEALVLELAVPGVDADDLDISIEGRQLTVRATLPALPEGEQRRYWLQSIPHGAFTRTVRLPSSVDTEQIKAQVHNGMLELRMPKVAEAKVRKVAIENR
jgi:HSP20 family protein